MEIQQLVSEKTEIDRLQRNFRILNAMSFFRMFLVIMPIFVPLMEHLGLSMTETMLLQSVFGLSLILLEVPSGYLADMWGRKKTLFVATLISGAGFSLLLWADSFWKFALFEFLLGIGASLLSGTDIALLYETENALEKQGVKSYRKANHISGMVSWMTFGEALAAVVASLLLLFSMEFIIYAQVIVGWVGFLLVLFLHEPDYQKMNEGSHKENLGKVVHHLFRQDRLLTQLIIIAVLMSTATWLAVWIYPKIWLQQNFSLEWFGWLWAGFNMIVAGSARIAPLVLAELDHNKMILLTVGLVIFGFLGLSLEIGLTVLLFGLAIQVARGFGSVVFREEINQTFESGFRATANSLLGLLFRLLTIICGPLMGFAIDRHGSGWTLGFITLFYAAVLIFLVIPWIRRNMERNRLDDRSAGLSCDYVTDKVTP